MKKQTAARSVGRVRRPAAMHVQRRARRPVNPPRGELQLPHLEEGDPFTREANFNIDPA